MHTYNDPTASVIIDTDDDVTIVAARNVRVIRCGDLWADGAKISGSLRADRATISGSLWADHATISGILSSASPLGAWLRRHNSP